MIVRFEVYKKHLFGLHGVCRNHEKLGQQKNLQSRLQLLPLWADLCVFFKS